MYYVYILLCIDSTYYTGITNNLRRRLAEHQTGVNKKSYTYKRGLWTLSTTQNLQILKWLFDLRRKSRNGQLQKKKL